MTDEPDSDSPQRQSIALREECESFEDCSSNAYCARDTCNDTGECQETPAREDCDDPVDQPNVCTCNSVEFESACLAKSRGQQPSDQEPPCNCDPSQCGEQQKCSRCGNGCIDVPSKEFCKTEDNQFEPVCGCNGRTYRNECFARADRVDVYREGNCTSCQDKCPDDGQTCAVCPGEDSLSCIERIPESVDCR